MRNDDFVEILVIRSGRFSAGIDLSEVAAVYAGTDRKDSGLVEEFRSENAFFDLSAMMPGRGQEENSCLIRIRRKEKPDGLVACPLIDGVAGFYAHEILLMPELVRKIANPLFVWGVVRHDGTDLLLVTFMRV